MADVSGVIKSYLEITFSTNANGKVSINIANPKADITEAQIKEIATFIVEKKLFTPKGETLTGLLKAKVVTSDTDKFDLQV